MFALETEAIAVKDVFELESILEKRRLLGRVFIAELLPGETIGEVSMVRLASPRALSREAAKALKETLIKEAEDILGPDPGGRILIRPVEVPGPSARPGSDLGR